MINLMIARLVVSLCAAASRKLRALPFERAMSRPGLTEEQRHELMVKEQQRRIQQGKQDLRVFVTGLLVMGGLIALFYWLFKAWCSTVADPYWP